MTPTTLADVLEQLLIAAERSHLTYEETHPGTEWPQYYTEYVHRALGSDYEVEQVSTSLRDASAAHGVFEEEQGGVRDEAWPRGTPTHGRLAVAHCTRQFAELDAWTADPRATANGLRR